MKQDELQFRLLAVGEPYTVYVYRNAANTRWEIPVINYIAPGMRVVGVPNGEWADGLRLTRNDKWEYADILPLCAECGKKADNYMHISASAPWPGIGHRYRASE